MSDEKVLSSPLVFASIGMLGFAIEKTVLHLGLFGQEIGAAS
jgi:hypothetical protein